MEVVLLVALIARASSVAAFSSVRVNLRYASLTSLRTSPLLGGDSGVPLRTGGLPIGEGERDLAALLEWASARGVVVPDGVSISDDTMGCGVRLTKMAEAGTVLLNVPTSVVLTSANLPENIEEDSLKDAAFILESSGVSQYLSEFRLMLRVLAEIATGQSSSWQPWIASLPSSFTTSLFLDDFEKTQLSPYALALVEFQETQFDAFRRAIGVVAKSSPLLSPIFEDGQGDDLVKWAFTVVFTRSWRTQAGDEANIVPVGDMFNHREEANVEVVEIPGSDNISFVLTDDAEAQSEIHLCYGAHSPSNFLAVFGFVDESMTTVPSHLEIPNANDNPKLVRLGCTERRKMVYRRDGHISDCVMDCVLFATLASQQEEQEKFYNATVEGDDSTKAAIHSKYALEVSLALRAHVDQVLDTFPDSAGVDVSSLDISSHKILPILLRYNVIMRETYQRVRDRLEEKVQDERSKRLKMLG